MIIVATGAKENKPIEYEYGKNEIVLTQTELEAILYRNKNSNFEDLPQTQNVSNLNSVVMINCVGSRDDERPYCSRICCTQAIKNALSIKEIKNRNLPFYDFEISLT